jgi:hypothetical protein
MARVGPVEGPVLSDMRDGILEAEAEELSPPPSCRELVGGGEVASGKRRSGLDPAASYTLLTSSSSQGSCHRPGGYGPKGPWSSEGGTLDPRSPPARPIEPLGDVCDGGAGAGMVGHIPSPRSCLPPSVDSEEDDRRRPPHGTPPPGPIQNWSRMAGGAAASTASSPGGAAAALGAHGHGLRPPSGGAASSEAAVGAAAALGALDHGLGPPSGATASSDAAGGTRGRRPPSHAAVGPRGGSPPSPEARKPRAGKAEGAAAPRVPSVLVGAAAALGTLDRGLGPPSGATVSSAAAGGP